MSLEVSAANVNFGGKSRYITPLMHSRLKNILTAMNADTKYVDNTKGFEYSTVTKLKLHYGKDNATLSDGRILMRKVSEKEQMTMGVTSIDMGKTHLLIDNNSGEILRCKKPFFKTFSKVMTQLQEAIYTFDSFYSVDKIVEKVKFSIHGLTAKGIEQLNSAK